MEQSVDAVIDAISKNTNIQEENYYTARNCQTSDSDSLHSLEVLYFQGYGIGMRDEQLKKLTKVAFRHRP